MTATDKLMDSLDYQSRAEPRSPLRIAHEILEQVRAPEAICLQEIELAADGESGDGQFLCQRSG